MCVYVNYMYFNREVLSSNDSVNRRSDISLSFQIVLALSIVSICKISVRSWRRHPRWLSSCFLKYVTNKAVSPEFLQGPRMDADLTLSIQQCCRSKILFLFSASALSNCDLDFRLLPRQGKCSRLIGSFQLPQARVGIFRPGNEGHQSS